MCFLDSSIRHEYLKDMALSDAAQCTARSKSTQQKCKNPAVTGSTKCRLHGGKSPRGVNAGNFKHGKWSKHMPSELLDKYQEALEDEQLNTTRQSVALLDALIGDMLPNLDTGDSGKAWERMKALVIDCRLAYKTESYGSLEKALDAMEDIANRRILHYETHKEIRATLDDRRKHVESEQKLLLMSEHAVSVEQVMLLMSQVLHVISTVVTDREQKYVIADEIQRLISIPAELEG